MSLSAAVGRNGVDLCRVISAADIAPRWRVIGCPSESRDHISTRIRPLALNAEQLGHRRRRSGRTVRARSAAYRPRSRAPQHPSRSLAPRRFPCDWSLRSARTHLRCTGMRKGARKCAKFVQECVTSRRLAGAAASSPPSLASFSSRARRNSGNITLTAIRNEPTKYSHRCLIPCRRPSTNIRTNAASSMNSRSFEIDAAAAFSYIPSMKPLEPAVALLAEEPDVLRPRRDQRAESDQPVDPAQSLGFHRPTLRAESHSQASNPVQSSCRTLRP